MSSICERLDGMPLAIELAAARTRSLSVESIAERLDDRFRLLRGGRKGDRHQTLGDTVSWSYNLLDPAEAAVFDRVSVFSGGFSLAAAESVCADGDLVDELDVVDILDALVDKSMIVVDTSGAEARYKLLETLRRYAEERLQEDGAAPHYRDAHAVHYRTLALQLESKQWTDEEPEVWQRRAAEWGNLRAAVAHARSTGDLETAVSIVASVGLYSVLVQQFEATDWALALVDLDGIADVERYGDLCGAASIGSFSGKADPEAALRYAMRGIEADQAFSLAYWGRLMVSLHTGDRAQTSHYLDLSRDKLGPHPDPGDLVWLDYLAATAEHSIEALPHADTALATATRTGSPSLIALAHTAYYFCLKDTDPANALEALDTAFARARSLSPRHVFALNARLFQVDLVAATLPPLDALGHCQAALQEAMDNHHGRVLYMTLENIALALARLGETTTTTRLRDHISAAGQLTPRQQRRIQEALDQQPPGESADSTANGATLTQRQACNLALATIDELVTADQTGTPGP